MVILQIPYPDHALVADQTKTYQICLFTRSLNPMRVDIHELLSTGSRYEVDNTTTTLVTPWLDGRLILQAKCYLEQERTVEVVDEDGERREERGEERGEREIHVPRPKYQNR